MGEQDERGLAAELKSISEIVRAIKRLPTWRARKRVIGHACAVLGDSMLVEVNLISKDHESRQGSSL